MIWVYCQTQPNRYTRHEPPANAAPQPAACLFPSSPRTQQPAPQRRPATIAWHSTSKQYTQQHTHSRCSLDLFWARSFVRGRSIAHLSITCKLAFLRCDTSVHSDSAADRHCLKPSFQGKLHRKPLLRRVKDMATSVKRKSCPGQHPHKAQQHDHRKAPHFLGKRPALPHSGMRKWLCLLQTWRSPWLRRRNEPGLERYASLSAGLVHATATTQGDFRNVPNSRYHRTANTAL